MAPGHALSALSAGLLMTAAVDLTSATASAVASIALAGAALLPDVDHPGSTATTAFGWLSRYAHRAVVWVHTMVCRLTWDPGETMPGAHRGVTHWWPAPPVAGALVGVPCYFSSWAALAVLTVLFALAVHGLTVPEYRRQDRDTRSVGFAHAAAGLVPTMWILKRARRRVRRIGNLGVFLACAGLAWLALRAAPELGQWLGVVVAVGMYIHIAGDAPTRSRVPGWTLRGEFPWPRRLAFRAGGTFEVICCWVPLSALSVLALLWTLVG